MAKLSFYRKETFAHNSWNNSLDARFFGFLRRFGFIMLVEFDLMTKTSLSFLLVYPVSRALRSRFVSIQAKQACGARRDDAANCAADF